MANLNQEGISSESVCDFDLFDSFSDKLDVTRTVQFSTYDDDCDQLDLYTDLFTSDLHEKRQNAEKALDDCQKLELENLKLQNKIQEITSNLEILKKQNFILKYNISSLYKTAKEEIDRKDLYIQELRESLDHMIFRRRKGLEKLTNSGSFKNDYEDRLERNHGEPQVLKQNKIIKNEEKFYHHSDKDKQKYHDKELHSNPENFKTHSLLPTRKSFKNSMKISFDSKTKHSREMKTYYKNHQRDDRKIKSKERRHDENLVSSKRSNKECNERFSKKENIKDNITNEKHSYINVTLNKHYEKHHDTVNRIHKEKSNDTVNRIHKEKSNRESIKTNLNAKERNNKKRI